MDVSVEIHCSKCGSANYSLPGSASAEACLSCNDCGASVATLGQLQEELMAQVIAHSSESLRSRLNRREDGGPEAALTG
jgi:uncharacterized Zn finger protein